jgi:ATPase subunit of ABC transporter with duplicated ATPase domains
MLFKDNVLVLDEPTNHLDLQSIAALSEGLQRYEGTVICVTHDQELIREVGSRIWSLHRGEPVLDFTGSFDDFVEKHPDLAGAHA